VHDQQRLIVFPNGIDLLKEQPAMLAEWYRRNYEIVGRPRYGTKDHRFVNQVTLDGRTLAEKTIKYGKPTELLEDMEGYMGHEEHLQRNPIRFPLMYFGVSEHWMDAEELHNHEQKLLMESLHHLPTFDDLEKTNTAEFSTVRAAYVKLPGNLQMGFGIDDSYIEMQDGKLVFVLVDPR